MVCFLETKVQEMSLKVVKSLGAGRFTNWGAINAKGALCHRMLQMSLLMGLYRAQEASRDS